MNKNIVRLLTLLGGLLMAALAVGFIFRVPFVLRLWPWEDGRYSYLFIGSILAAASAAAIWIGWTGEVAALPAGSLNIFVIDTLVAIYFFYLAAQGRSNLYAWGVTSAILALASGALFVWSRPLALSDMRPTPRLVRVSFVIFVITLLMAGTALILRIPVFPWKLNPDSAVIFGSIFLGDAFYFLYGLLRPQWGNAFGQLLSFLVYDLVLIVPFFQLFATVQPDRMLSLVIYTAVLIYSAVLAVYSLWIRPPAQA